MLLALDTATQTASITIFDLDQNLLLSEWTWLSHRRQTQDLLQTARVMFEQHQLDIGQITAVAVTTGPGSFTGVRIAISAAKGIGLGIGHEVAAVGIPTLSVIAAPWCTTDLTPSSTDTPYPRLCPLIQAGRGRYNWAVAPASLGVGVSQNALWRPTADAHYAGTCSELETFLRDEVQQPILLIGEISDELSTMASQLDHVAIGEPFGSWRRSGYLARAAALHLDAGNGETLASLQPLYLRAP